MITTIATVSVFVEDQERAKAFYTEKLGFELINDSEVLPGSGMLVDSEGNQIVLGQRA